MRLLYERKFFDRLLSFMKLRKGATICYIWNFTAIFKGEVIYDYVLQPAQRYDFIRDRY